MAKEQKNKNGNYISCYDGLIYCSNIDFLYSRKIIHVNVLSDVEDSYTFVLLYCSKIMKKEVIYV